VVGCDCGVYMRVAGRETVIGDVGEVKIGCVVDSCDQRGLVVVGEAGDIGRGEDGMGLVVLIVVCGGNKGVSTG
jgi:hypothetical protein